MVLKVVGSLKSLFCFCAKVGGSRRFRGIYHCFVVKEVYLPAC